MMVFAANANYRHAKLHPAWREQQAPDFVLDCLPPYSPELNPPSVFGSEPGATAFTMLRERLLRGNQVVDHRVNFNRDILILVKQTGVVHLQGNRA